jgi:predicted transcriptional regulator
VEKIGASMQPNEALQLDTRKRIFELINANPGIHFREIQRKLNMPLGLLSYHLDYLEKNKLIATRRDTYYTRFYPRREHDFDHQDKAIISFLRQEIPRGIIIFLLQNPNSKHKEILQNFNVSGATISYHLKRMAQAEVVRQTKLGRETEYSIANEVKTINLIITYQRSFLDKLVDSFARTWLEKYKK